MNVLEILRRGDKIKKAQIGTNLDVDTRSDTTRLGYHEGVPSLGAANASNIAGLWDLMNYNITGNPNIITGAPTFLPGRINLRGLTTRTVRPIKLTNPVNNPAERAAAMDYMEETGLVVNTTLPKGRPAGDYRYPKDALKPAVTRNTNIKSAKVTLSERYYDRKTYSKKERTLDKNNRAYESKDARAVNSGLNRVKNRLVENVSANISKYPQHELRKLDKLKLKLAKRGLTSEEIEKHKEVKEFYRNLADLYGYYEQGGKINIRKMQTAAGGPLVLSGKSKKEVDEINNYNKNKSKGLFKGMISGKVLPTMSNIGSMLGAAYNGWLDPETTAITGDVPNPGMRNPKLIAQTATKIGRTLEDYLKTTKVTAPALEGSSMARSAYATDRYIGGRMFLNTLPDLAMSIQGHGMSKSPTMLDALARLRYILDNGIKGKFYTAPLKVSKEAAMAGEAIGTGGATPYFDGHFLITGKPGLMINSVDDIGTVYINDAYENEEALKAALKLLQYLLLTYPKINFKLYSLGFKQGGKMNILEFLKNGSGIHIKKKNRGKFREYCGGEVTDECIRKAKASGNPTLVKRATFADNARHFKHKSGGKAFYNGISILDSDKNAYKRVKKKYRMHLQGGALPWINFGVLAMSNIYSNIKKNKTLDSQSEYIDKQIEFNNLKAKAEAYNKAFALGTDRSGIVNANRAWQQSAGVLADNSDLLKLKAALLGLKTSILNGIDFGLLGNLIGNIDFSSNNSTTQTTSPINTPTWNTTTKNYLFNKPNPISTPIYNTGKYEFTLNKLSNGMLALNDGMKFFGLKNGGLIKKFQNPSGSLKIN